jgi:hypothetical protein
MDFRNKFFRGKQESVEEMQLEELAAKVEELSVRLDRLEANKSKKPGGLTLTKSDAVKLAELLVEKVKLPKIVYNGPKSEANKTNGAVEKSLLSNFFGR